MTTKFQIGKTYQDPTKGDKYLVVRRRNYNYGTHVAKMVWFQRNGDYYLSYVRIYEKDGVEYVNKNKFFKGETTFEFTANDVCGRYESKERVEVYCTDEDYLPTDRPYIAEPNTFFATWKNADYKYYRINGTNYSDHLFVEF